jgi:hypothetical protein
MLAAEPSPSPTPEAAASARIIVERPPPGLARGKYAAPAWAIALLGGALVLFGAAYVLWRLRRAHHR